MDKPSFDQVDFGQSLPDEYVELEVLGDVLMIDECGHLVGIDPEARGLVARWSPPTPPTPSTPQQTQ